MYKSVVVVTFYLSPKLMTKKNKAQHLRKLVPEFFFLKIY